MQEKAAREAPGVLGGGVVPPGQQGQVPLLVDEPDRGLGESGMALELPGEGGRTSPSRAKMGRD